MTSKPINGVFETAPGVALELQRQGARLLDVREQSEWEAGHAQGAEWVPLSRWMDLWEGLQIDPSQDVLIICRSGGRSRQAGEFLAQRGFTQVHNISGGTMRWQTEGLPMQTPEIGLTTRERERYARHLALPQVGLEGQLKLKNARVLLVGAGGLGSPAALYLAAAGVGTLRVVDADVVDRSNLQRQILHQEQSIGEAKVSSAARALHALNPDVVVEAYEDRIQASNVDAALNGCDVVLDGSDNTETRYLLNDACARHGLALVYGAIHRFEGQVSVFDVAKGGPCYRCLFPVVDGPIVQNCAQAGVLGALPGVIGTLQALEAIKLILEIGEPLREIVLSYDALETTFRRLNLTRDPECRICHGQSEAVPVAVTCTGHS